VGKKFAYIRDLPATDDIGQDRDYRLVEIAIPRVEPGGGTAIPSTGIQGTRAKAHWNLNRSLSEIRIMGKSTISS